MEVKVYRRVKDEIELYTCTHIEELNIFLNANYVKNAQELIQVGDLVYSNLHGFKYEVEDVRENSLDICAGITIAKCDVDKIYTPNEDKSIYTLQWSKEEMK